MKICFVDRSTHLDGVLDVNKPRGGMITSLFKVSDYLSRLGHKVVVLSDIKHPGVTKSGVLWLNQYNLEEYDVLILNRGIGDGHSEIRAKKRILWTHDLPHNGFIPEPKNIRAFHTVFMSKYAEKVWRTFYKDIKKSTIIPNGVDKTIFKDYGYVRDQLIFASAPNRGLKRLPLIYEAINTRHPIPMKAFSNLKVLHPNEAHHQEKEQIKDSFELDYKSCAEVGIEMHDPISQKRLAQQLAKSKLMILPTDYPEICSNIILQSLACGVPVITTGKLGSAGEWVTKKNGRLTTYLPHDYMVYQVQMVRNAVEVLDDEKLHEKLVKGALKTKILDWEQVGYKWNKLLNSI